jgi:hypothetical protein
VTSALCYDEGPAAAFKDLVRKWSSDSDVKKQIAGLLRLLGLLRLSKQRSKNRPTTSNGSTG